MSKTVKNRVPRLGRGLSNLLSQPVEVPAQQGGAPTATTGKLTVPSKSGSAAGIEYLPLDAIKPNPNQPRQKFDPRPLQQLADSIKTAGLMQPVIVRRVESAQADGGPSFQLVAGERRWRASRIAGLAELPAIVQELNETQLAEWALIENLQREDLNPIERAGAFEHLVDRFKLTHDDVAKRVGVDRSTISNSLRLLHLSADVQDLVREGLLSGGHAKALTSVADIEHQRDLAKRAVRQGWSVRQLEAVIRRLTQDPIASQPAGDRRSAHLADLEKQIGQQLHTKVSVRPGRKKGSGTLSIEFYDTRQFDALLAKLGVETQQ